MIEIGPNLMTAICAMAGALAFGAYMWAVTR